MSESSPPPTVYQVICSEDVRRDLLSFAGKAQERGLRDQYLASLKEIDSRLRIYPQFGEPLKDLQLKPSRLWIGSLWPIVVRYTVDDERRMVFVVAPFLLLPKSDS